MKLKLRNSSYIPSLGREGTFICPMPSPPSTAGDGGEWHKNLRPYERMYYHQTLSSVRQCKRFLPTSEIPKDSLDFQLQSRYNNAFDIFPEKVDNVLQVETCSPEAETFRVLRNTLSFETVKPPSIGHPLAIGGITEKKSPFSVKLITSGHHSQLSNNGYSRQPADGNFFRY